jgi:uncharacterized CHY-type Zn-finger protein
MKATVSYEGESGLLAVVKALDNVRLLLAETEVDPEQAAGYLGCINMHLAELVGASDELVEQLENCPGLLCPHCRGYIGSASNLSGDCPFCGEPFFPSATGHGHTGGQAQAR